MTKLSVLIAVVALGSGCTNYYQSKMAPPIQLASTQNSDPDYRYFNPPFALAVPEDAVVRVVGPWSSCSGTLIAEDLVLTAHHCVTTSSDAGAPNLAPKDVTIELGGDYLPWGTIGVNHVMTPPCGERGGAGDLAVLVLERKLIGIVPFTVRLYEPPKPHETLDPAGFGRCALSADGIHRNSRPGGPIENMAWGTISMTASICPGDSGGPIISRGSHEVVGVVSMSAMDGDERTRSPSLVARVDAFRDLFANARLVADGLSASELPPVSCK